MSKIFNILIFTLLSFTINFDGGTTFVLSHILFFELKVLERNILLCFLLVSNFVGGDSNTLLIGLFENVLLLKSFNVFEFRELQEVLTVFKYCELISTFRFKFLFETFFGFSIKKLSSFITGAYLFGLIGGSS